MFKIKNKKEKMGGRKPDYKTGKRRKIIELLLTVVVPQKGLFLLGDPYIYAKALRKIADEGIVKEVVIQKKHMFVLNDFENNGNKYLKDFRIGCYGYYNLYGKNNAYRIAQGEKKWGQEVQRAYRQGLTLVMLYSVGVKSTSDIRPSLNQIDVLDSPPYYFTALEVKGKKGRKKVSESVYREIDLNNDKVDAGSRYMSTRAMGVLFSNGGIYSIYNIEQKNTNWVDRSEINFSAYAYSVGMRKEMKQEDNKSRALIFYRNEKRIRDVLIGDKNKNYLSLGQCGFDRLYMIPYSLEGQLLLKDMTEAGWEKKRIKEICRMENLSPDFEVNRLSVDCDGTLNDTYYFFFTNCELCRLNRFIKGARWNLGGEDEFIVYCFDWQKPGIEEFVGNAATIRVIPFDRCQNMLTENCK